MLANRLLLLRGLVVLIFLVFAGTLAYVQLGHGGEFLQASEHNYLRWVRSPAPRGRILDRNGRPLATSVPALGVWLVSGEVPRDGWDTLYRQLVALGIYPDVAFASTRLAECRRFPGYVPVRLASGLSIKDPLVTRLEESLPFLPGVFIRTEPVRFYPGGPFACHTLGYLSEIDAEGLRELRDAGYRMGDRLGRTGIERAFEADLRGIDGGEQVEVDALGRKLSESAKVAPRSGKDLTLTLDLDVQLAAEQAMQGHRGAVVALNPANGDILALVSSPEFDLNATGIHRAEFNRAVRGQYPPGSVFKIVTAAAGLETGVITPNSIFYCDGEYRGIHCWKHSGHGALSLNGALAHSCNVYFMRVAERVGVEKLAAMARRFDLGQETPIDGIFTGQAGRVPDPKRERARGVWMPGETLQMGIGQSALLVTPVQSACIAASMANGGHLVHPRLVRRIGEQVRPAGALTPIGIKPETIRRIDNGLRAVVETGTAKQLDPGLQIAGKTGTAQNPGGEDHAWFAGYAPASHPTVAVAVLVENGGHGGVIAAPIAQAVIRAALGKTARAK